MCIVWCVCGYKRCARLDFAHKTANGSNSRRRCRRRRCCCCCCFSYHRLEYYYDLKLAIHRGRAINGRDHRLCQFATAWHARNPATVWMSVAYTREYITNATACCPSYYWFFRCRCCVALRLCCRPSQSLGPSHRRSCNVCVLSDYSRTFHHNRDVGHLSGYRWRSSLKRVANCLYALVSRCLYV